MNTSYIEPLHATFRSRLVSLMQRTRYGARRQSMSTLGTYLVGTVYMYNFCTPHNILTNAQEHRRTLAMASGLTHHV